MTNTKILNLAYQAALENWEREKERLERNPDNPYTKAREKARWDEVTEIQSMLMAEDLKAMSI